jgi:polysaccharide biosynthesis protein PslG
MHGRLSGVLLIVLIGSVLAPLLALPSAAPVAAATGFASPRFKEVWDQSDKAVEEGRIARTWLWGPQPLNALQEPYKDSPGGQRQVQYFDKSRMEINNPATGAVTNGLLANELISGMLQISDAEFENRGSAQVNVAGDPGTGPNYADLAPLRGQAPLAVGTVITARLLPGGQVLEGQPAPVEVRAAYLVPETNHVVAAPFWTYMTGPGAVSGNPFFATGFPTTEAYWAEVRVGGVARTVLVQAFERRVLTYTPGNPDGFLVEMGNVGQHYFRWRYGADPAPATGGYVPLTGPNPGYGFNGFFSFTPVSSPNSQEALRRSLRLVREAGFDWIRQQVVWSTLQPTNPGAGSFVASINAEQLAMYDAIVREAAQRSALIGNRRVKIMFSVTKAPAWAVADPNRDCSGPAEARQCGLPRDPQSLARLFSFLADRYKDGSQYGRVEAWEVWNEQNLAHESGSEINASVYVEALKASYTAIKAADPGAVVVFGGLSPTGVTNKAVGAYDDVRYLEEAYQYNNGEMKLYFDVMGAHPGSNNNPPDALWPDNPGPGTGCAEADGNCWKRDPSFYFRRIEQLRAVMEKYGDAEYNGRLKQIWLTEFGWTTRNLTPGYEYGSVISEDLQRAYILRAFEKGRTEYPWMGVMFLWTLNHSVVVGCKDEKYPWSMVYGSSPSDPDCALVQPPGVQPWQPRPAYNGLREMPKTSS